MRRFDRDTWGEGGFDPRARHVHRHAPEGGHRRRRGRPGGNRARRGDVRAAALTLVAERPMHGYEIIQEIETRSDGVWKPSPGSVYPTLQLLQDEGLVTSSEIDGRRVFTVTDAGRVQVTERAEQGGVPPWVEVADDAGEPMQRLGRALRSVVVASKQLLREASPSQQDQAVTILNDARRRLYGLLADDEDREMPSEQA